MARLRDNPECVDQEASQIARTYDGLSSAIVPAMSHVPEMRRMSQSRPRVAILREQGVNGHIEMAHAFDHCGFEAIDVHMSDLMSGRQTLESFDVTNFTFSECVDGEGSSATLEVTYDESTGHVQVNHNAHQANCCAEFGLTATGSSAGQVSVVYEDSGMECNCICGFDLSYRLVGLPSGEWSVRVPDGLSGTVTVP